MESSIYLADSISNTFYVISQQYQVIWKLKLSMEPLESSLLPPKLQISQDCSSENRQIAPEELNKRYKYIYICHTSHFNNYKLFYVKGMVHIYCINDVRFLEKPIKVMR